MFSTTVRVAQTLTVPKLTMLRNTIIIIKANEIYNFSNLFDNVLYMLRTVDLSVTCREHYQINLRNCASLWLLL